MQNMVWVVHYMRQWKWVSGEMYNKQESGIKHLTL